MDYSKRKTKSIKPTHCGLIPMIVDPKVKPLKNQTIRNSNNPNSLANESIRLEFLFDQICVPIFLTCSQYEGKVYPWTITKAICRCSPSPVTHYSTFLSTVYGAQKAINVTA